MNEERDMSIESARVTPEPVTPEQEREWRATHVESSGRIGGDSWCQICGIRGEPADGPWWPCPVILSLDALAASGAENERLKAECSAAKEWQRFYAHQGDTLKAENADMSEQLRVSLDAAVARPHASNAGLVLDVWSSSDSPLPRGLQVTPARERKAQLEHERLMHAAPHPHDGWAYCRCALAAEIRRYWRPAKPKALAKRGSK